MKFKRENIKDVSLDIEEIIDSHFEEVSPFQDILPNPDVSFYCALEDRGFLRTYAARNDLGALCGYCVFFVQVHPHFKSKQALCDLLYLKPEHRSRSVGSEFVKFIESSLMAEKDIDVIFFSSTSKKPIGKIFERLGYQQTDVRYAKRVIKQ